MGNSCKRRAEKCLIEFENMDDAFDPRKYFKAGRSLGLELGIGKGRFLRDWSKQKPAMGLMGVEIKKDRANRAALKLEDAGFEDTFVLRCDVSELFKRLPATPLFDAIHLNFPDPWPKKRHAKKRLLGPLFIEGYLKHLKPGASLVFVTDDPNYALEGQQNLRDRPELVDVYEGIRYNWPCYPVSIHEEKFRKWGRVIHYQKFKRKVRLA
jgi:tRNA (guanine-N7-)-methyltransferase